MPLSVLKEAEQHFHDAIQTFQAVTERVRDGDKVSATEANSAARALHAATQTLFTLKLRIEDELRKREGAVAGPAIDIDAARVEIRERLDRLRAARDAG